MVPTPSVRRGSGVLLLACGLAATAPVVLARAIPPTNASPEIKVIDMHTHVFNARDLPLKGILNARGAPPLVAQIVAAILIASTKEDDAANLDVRMEDVERPTFSRPLSPAERKTLEEYVGTDQATRQPMAKELRVTDDVVLVAETMAKTNFPPDEQGSKRHVDEKGKLRISLPSLQGFLRFIGIVTRPHPQIVATLKKSYPEVDLFVHHMMDLEVGYADLPTVPFDQQIKVAQALDALFPGQLLHFSAFDPFRRQNALDLATTGVNDFGAVGLKIYPPSGYRAAENAKLKFPQRPSADGGALKRWKSRYAGWTEADLDATLQGIFAWSRDKKDVPLFTHCTRGGFEAAEGYGKMANPSYWGTALQNNDHVGLRLCFGHAGGDEYWFSDPDKDSQNRKDSAWQFGGKVVKLCLKYPNVYSDVGYLAGIRDHRKVGYLLKRLRSLMKLESDDKTWCFGDKLMYGTDWHMMFKEPDYDKYLKRWDQVMKQVDSGKWRQKFFAGNAKKFLQLDNLSKDQRLTQQQQNALATLSAGIK